MEGDRVLDFPDACFLQFLISSLPSSFYPQGFSSLNCARLKEEEQSTGTSSGCLKCVVLALARDFYSLAN